MTKTYTSRGTYIEKVSMTVKGAFPIDDIISIQGEFINELNEMHRFKGSQIDMAYIRDTLVPNVQSIIEQSKQKIYQLINDALPSTDDVHDPVIKGVNIYSDIEIEYTRSPYIEKKVIEYNEQGKLQEVTETEVTKETEAGDFIDG